MRNIPVLLTLFCTFLISGCSSFEFPGVYKLSIPQGNIVEQEMIDQLEPGMTMNQVRFIMGTPLLVDTVNENRWDYPLNSLAPDGTKSSKKLSIYFDENDKMQHFEGDWETSPEEQTIETKTSTQADSK